MTMTMMMVMAVMRQAESATQKLLFFFSVWLAAVLSSAWVWFFFLQSGVPLAGNQESVHFAEKQTKTEDSFIRATVAIPFSLCSSVKCGILPRHRKRVDWRRCSDGKKFSLGLANYSDLS